MTEQRIDPEQFEVAIRSLEVNHGAALKYKMQGRASALYHAIDMLEGARNGELRTDFEKIFDDDDQDLIELSREAREAGMSEATLLDEIGKGSYHSRPSVLEKVAAWLK